MGEMDDVRKYHSSVGNLLICVFSLSKDISQFTVAIRLHYTLLYGNWVIEID